MLSTDVPAGATVVILGAEDGNDYQIVGVSDTKGNAYQRVLSYKNTNFQPSNQLIWAAYMTSALTKSDTIHIIWSPPPASYRSYGVSIAYLTGVSATGQPEATAENNAYMRSPAVTIPGRTIKKHTIIIGAILANDFQWTIGPGWTIYDHKAVNIKYDWFYKIATSSGIQDPGGVGTVTGSYSAVWASFAANEPQPNQ